MHWTTTKIFIAALSLFLLAGCAGQSETGFGDSVRHMTKQQIHNLDAAYNPDPNPPLGGDVKALNQALETHRKSASNPAEAPGMTGLISGSR